MTLKQTLTDSITRLRDSFAKALRSPLPEPEIRVEMEKEGWTFETYHSAAGIPYAVMPVCVTYVTDPEGRPAWNGNATEEQARRFSETVSQKRVAHGLKP